MKIVSERWFNDTTWEADYPEGWKAFRDKSIRGFPYVFESSAGSRLQVGLSMQGTISGFDWSEAPEDLTKFQKQAYLITLQEARNQSWVTWPEWALAHIRQKLGYRPQLEKRIVGAFVGFTYECPPRIEHQRSRAGHFSAEPEPYAAYLYFRASEQSYEADSAVAWDIIGTIKLHVQQGVPADGLASRGRG